jgi:hypothetical protein
MLKSDQEIQDNRHAAFPPNDWTAAQPAWLKARRYRSIVFGEEK